jgi:hypothetical protein
VFFGMQKHCEEWKEMFIGWPDPRSPSIHDAQNSSMGGRQLKLGGNLQKCQLIIIGFKREAPVTC